MRAEGVEREALQGLIQVAVGFQHLANRNVVGARALLRDGAARLDGHRLDGRVLSAFADQVARCLHDLGALGPEAAARFDWSRVPRFPAGG
jgi:predicted metal-dependent hydrolase